MLIATMFHNNQVAKQTPWVTQPKRGWMEAKRCSSCSHSSLCGFWRLLRLLKCYFPCSVEVPRSPEISAYFPSGSIISDPTEYLNATSVSYFKKLLTFLHNRNKTKASDRALIRFLSRSTGKDRLSWGPGEDLDGSYTQLIICLNTWQ